MSGSKSISQKLWRIHNWVGLYAGVFIAVLSVTGVIALFKVEIDEAIHARYFKIEPPVETAGFHPDVNKLIDSLSNEYGKANFTGISLSLDKSRNWIFGTRRAESDSLPKIDSYQLFFNPYTAQVVGARDAVKTFSYYIRHLHVRFFNGFLGRWWVGLGGVALIISTITGILIYGHFMKGQFFGAIRNRSLKLKSADYHKLIGMTTLLFNLMIAITGAWLGLQAILRPVLQIESPGRYTRTEKPISKDQDVAYSVDFIKAFETSRTLFPDLTPNSMAPSKDGSRMIIIRGDVPKTAYQSNVNYLFLDKKSFQELARYDIREKSLGDKAYYAQEGLHYGDFGGIWVKVIYSFFGLTSGALSMLGFVLYLERTKSKQRKKANYKTTGRKVGLWTFWITALCVLLYVLTVTVDQDIPTSIITLAFWSPLLFYLVKYLVILSKRGFKALAKKVKSSL
ncbi:MAG: PepSY-associated TM helix domain-containing protein [Bacteroidota bacterium]